MWPKPPRGVRVFTVHIDTPYPLGLIGSGVISNSQEAGMLLAICDWRVFRRFFEA
jgi:hypothetical protein